MFQNDAAYVVLISYPFYEEYSHPALHIVVILVLKKINMYFVWNWQANYVEALWPI